MTEQTVDPITGLDTSIVDPFLYQIPLTTNPIQAPEWGFQGHYDQILHPDNIPAVFATAQGYDESNPGAAQAHHMDGDGNLYVNVRKNEASGGGSAGIPATARAFTQSRYAGFGDLDFPLGTGATKLYSFTGHIHSWRDDLRTAQHLDIELGWEGGLEQLTLYNVDPDYHFMTYPPNDVLYTIDETFSGGYDLTGSFPYAGDAHIFVNGGSSFWGAFSFMLIYEP